MDKNSENTPIVEPSICTKCGIFYGTSHTAFLCSKCFKESEPLIQNKIEESKKETNAVLCNTIENSQQSLPLPEKKSEQENKSLCWNCNKKVGLMGHACKCEYVFCKKHRLPESHNCDFDYQNYARLLIEKSNPVVKNDKLDKI